MVASTVILTPERLQAEVDYFMTKDAFVYDVETIGEFRGVPTQNEIIWLSMATYGRAVVIPMGHPNGDVLISPAHRKKNPLTGKMDMIPAVYDAPPEQMLPSQAWEILRPLMMSDLTKVAQNATFDLISVAKYLGGPPAPPYSDTIVLQWLLDENLLLKGLKDMVKRYYSVDYDKEEVGKQVEAHPFSKVAHYAYMDAKYTWLLWRKFLPEINEEGLNRVRRLEENLLPILVKMGLEGAPVDEAAMHRLVEEMDHQMEKIEADTYRAAGKTFNLNSPPQVAEVLFKPKTEGGQGLKPVKLTKGGAPSTDADSLSNYPRNPVVKGIRDYSDVGKLRDYPVAYLGDDTQKKKPRRIFDGRIHTDLVQYGTVTGRFSSRAPNLQNIPRPGTELGAKVRGLFIPPTDGDCLIVGDYGQIELVLMAHYIGHGVLYDAFHQGVDAHLVTAAGVAGKAPEDVTKDERQHLGKTMNFIIAYGGGITKVMAEAKCSKTRAGEILEAHKRSQSEVYKWKASVIADARRQRPPHIRTLSGRKRRLPLLFSSDAKWRSGAERQAVNSLIQGGAADIIKMAMVNTGQWPSWMKLILSVHDELVAICPRDRADKGIQLLEEAMLAPNITSMLRVPLKVDIKAVERWSEAK